MRQWFVRFGDIPGVEYAGSAQVDRDKLPGHNARPSIQIYESNGKREESLSWPVRAGGTGSSSSPAFSYAFADIRDLPIAALLQRLAEGLELPGTPSDYHFLLQNTANELWRQRRDAPEVLEHVESLCWLDIRLVETCPEYFMADRESGPRFYQLLAFSILITLYEREGFLHEALAVADRAAPFEQAADERQQLLTRIAAVEAEDVE